MLQVGATGKEEEEEYYTSYMALPGLKAHVKLGSALH
jgi:hypothetical protein